MNTEIEVGGRRYRIGKINAMQQFHVVRRLAPILATMGVSMESIRKGVKMTEADLIAALAPAAQVLSHMSDEDVDYIVATCLGVVTREQVVAGSPPLWAPVTRGAQMMFDDIDMPAMIRLVVGVLQSNLQDFLKGLAEPMTSPGSSPTAKPQATTMS